MQNQNMYKNNDMFKIHDRKIKALCELKSLPFYILNIVVRTGYFWQKTYIDFLLRNRIVTYFTLWHNLFSEIAEYPNMCRLLRRTMLATWNDCKSVLR